MAPSTLLDEIRLTLLTFEFFFYLLIFGVAFFFNKIILKRHFFKLLMDVNCTMILENKISTNTYISIKLSSYNIYIHYN